jgi:hypothetical protein
MSAGAEHGFELMPELFVGHEASHFGLGPSHRDSSDESRCLGEPFELLGRHDDGPGLSVAGENQRSSMLTQLLDDLIVAELQLGSWRILAAACPATGVVVLRDAERWIGETVSVQAVEEHQKGAARNPSLAVSFLLHK